MEEDKKTYKYMTMFSVIIAVVVVAQIILANYLQSHSFLIRGLEDTIQ